MKNQFRIFEYIDKEVRVIQKKDESWFVLKDVCDVLGLSDVSMTASRLDDDELTQVKLVSGGQNRSMIIVNEPGLYDVILRSDKPIAREFRRWITHEVIPSIRQTGQYSLDQQRWDVLRKLTKQFHNLHNRIIDGTLRQSVNFVSERHQKAILADEADLLNVVVFGLTAHEWRRMNPDKKGNMRDYATDDQLLMLLIAESINSMCIGFKVPLIDRLGALRHFASSYFVFLKDWKNEDPKSLEEQASSLAEEYLAIENRREQEYLNPVLMLEGGENSTLRERASKKKKGRV